MSIYNLDRPVFPNGSMQLHSNEYSNLFGVDDKRNILDTLDENSNFQNTLGNDKATSSQFRKKNASRHDRIHVSSESDESIQPDSETSSESSFSDIAEPESKSKSKLNRKRKRKSSSKEWIEKPKKQKTSKFNRIQDLINQEGRIADLACKDCEVLNIVRNKIFDMNTDLCNLSKSIAILEEDVALYQKCPGVSRSLYTAENLPMFPFATKTNEFSSGGLAVFVPVQTVGEVNDLNSILNDKIAFEDLVSVIECLSGCS